MENKKLYDANRILQLAKSFVEKLYSDEYYTIYSNRDPFHDDAKMMIIILYEWLFEKHLIDEKTEFSIICGKINETACNFFELDMSDCSQMLYGQWYLLKQQFENCLKSESDSFKFLVLVDLRVVFDLTALYSHLS